MSEYRVRASGELKSETDLRLENRNVSFPKVWNTNVFEALGIDPVLAAPAPTPSGEFKVVGRNGAVQDSNGNWVYAWVEREMFAEYTDEDGNVQTVSAQQTAHTARINNEKAIQERSRVSALVESHSPHS